jgi:HSP20 family molecular chaperone IbpA
MFFAPALKRNAVSAPKQNTEDLGFERFMSNAFRSLIPNFHDMQEDGNSWTVTLDVPGVARNQLVVNVVGNRVEVQTTEDAKRHVQAAYELPGEIDADKCEASLQDGVLTLKLAKVESAMARQIKIS